MKVQVEEYSRKSAESKGTVAMPFPPAGGIKIGQLAKATPTPFDVSALRQQMTDIGLNCAQLTDAMLQQYIGEVTSQIPAGATQTFGIKMPPTSPAITVGRKALLAARPEPEVGSLEATVPQYVQAATGNWTISNDAQGYAPQLELIQFPAHFDWLYGNRSTNGFTGTKDDPPAYTGNYPNAEAIKTLFINVCITASATLVKGIDQDSMKATLTNVISPLTDNNLTNYDQSDSRTIFLVDNYNSSTGYADAIGVLYVGWRLQISDYKRKTKDGGDTHPTVLTISAGSVLYSDPTILCKDYNSVLTQFGIDPNKAPPCPPAGV